MKNFNQFLKITLGLLTAVMLSILLSQYFSVSFLVPFAFVLLIGSFPRPKGVVLLDLSPDVTGIMNYLGQVRPQLFGTLFNNFDIANDITLVPNVKNTLRLTKLLINNGAEPYSGIFEPNDNDIGYSEQDLVVTQWQRDLLMDPRKYRTTYLAPFQAPGSGTLNNTIPFAQYTVMQFLKSLAASMNDTSAFFGLGVAAFTTYNAGTAYAVGAAVKYIPSGKTKLQYYICAVATVAGQSPDTTPDSWTKRNDLALCVGLGTHIINDRNEEKITNVVSTGVISDTSGAYDQAKSVFRALPDPVKSQGANVYMPINVWEFLQDDFENKVGKYTETDQSGLIYLANTGKKAVIKPTTWQRGSQMIIATPKANLLMGTDLISDMNEINVIPDVYTIKWGMAGVLGFNYQDAAVMAINDQN